MKTLHLADLFCGAGGTSAGACEAIELLGFAPALTAVNHWPVAIDTHTANHPLARHLCTAVDEINPRKLFAPGELDLLWASPECTHHSNARGGKPSNEQSRATAWCVPRWMEAVRPQVVLVENVPEFEKWGPKKNGRTFRAWFEACHSMGYRAEAKVFCAADDGDPTTRRRLFVQFVRGRRRITWPDPTHAEHGAGGLAPWVPAREIIDWDLQGQSIFDRARPLSDKTLARIWAGLQKFGLGPFIVPAQSGRVRGVGIPLQTVACDSRGIGLANPFLICMEHGGRVDSVDRPVRTITTAKGGAIGVASPFLIHAAHGGDRPARSIDAPLPTVAGNRGDLAICQPALLPQGGGGIMRPISEPAPTIHCDGAVALVEPFLVNYYGTGGPRSVGQPLDTVTTKDRFGLVRPLVVVNGERYLLDVRFRMLQPRELALAQGFRADYQFSGNKTEQVKQIGNAVPRNLARALVLAALGQKASIGDLLGKVAA